MGVFLPDTNKFLRFEIKGVINPIKESGNNQGIIKIGIKNKIYSYFDEFNNFSAVIETSNAPKWLKIISIT